MRLRTLVRMRFVFFLRSIHNWQSAKYNYNIDFYHTMHNLYTFHLCGLVQKILCFLSLRSAYTVPTVSAAGRAGGITIANISTARKIVSFILYAWTWEMVMVYTKPATAVCLYGKKSKHCNYNIS